MGYLWITCCAISTLFLCYFFSDIETLVINKDIVLAIKEGNLAYNIVANMIETGLEKVDSLRESTVYDYSYNKNLVELWVMELYSQEGVE